MRRKGRASTCVRSGSRVTVLRFTSICFIGRPPLPCRFFEPTSLCFVSAAFPPATAEKPAWIRPPGSRCPGPRAAHRGSRRSGGVEFQPQIVPAKEPVEGALRLSVPPWVGRGAVCFQASRNRGVRLDGLLVEVRACAVTPIESVAADGPQLPMLRSLYAHKPAQRL